jgi:hypothetical protein
MTHFPQSLGQPFGQRHVSQPATVWVRNVTLPFRTGHAQLIERTIPGDGFLQFPETQDG